MKFIRTLFVAVVLFGLNACRECNIVNDSGNPDRYIRLFDQQDNNLWFGSNAIYDPNEVEFTHPREGQLDVSVHQASNSVSIKFPVTQNQAEEITMRLDSATSHTLSYNTLTFTNNECEKEYTLSYVKFRGEQVCGNCGETQFNDDRYINLRL